MSHELDQILIFSSQPDFKERLIKLFETIILATYFDDDSDDDKRLKDILGEVVKHGDKAIADFMRKGLAPVADFEERDKAIAKFTEKFDGGVKLTPGQFQVSKEGLEKAYRKIDKEDKELLKSIRQAIKNVRKYQKEIFIGRNKSCSGGTGIKYTPIKRVGICVPGAAAPLPSTVIMCAVPAQVAGVKEIVVVSPPRYNGDIHPVTLAVCYELGIDEVYRIGGAQAVMALAQGTKTIPNVDKIVGPGNQWVQMAKKEVFGLVGIDSIAGPSEVLIIANDKANPAWVAADMLSQAEHGPGSAVVFTDAQNLAHKTLKELKKQVAQLNRKETTIKCLLKFGAIVVFDDMDDVIDWANLLAAEHVEIQCGEQSRPIADQIENAGAIFIGDYSPVAVGDYWAGPSHTLPTARSARFSSALSSNDFIKSTSIIEYDKEKLLKSADDIIRLAETEGLDAHAKSIKIRQQD